MPNHYVKVAFRTGTIPSRAIGVQPYRRHDCFGVTVMDAAAPPPTANYQHNAKRTKAKQWKAIARTAIIIIPLGLIYVYTTGYAAYFTKSQG